MRRNRATFARLLLLLACFLPAFTASAQPAPRTADDYVLEGRELAGKNDLEGAYKAYLIAWDLKKSYDLAANLAVVELSLGKARDAAEHFAYCVQNYPAVKDAAQTEKLKKVQELLAKAKENVGAARVGLVADDGRSVEGAEVLVSGALVGRWPLGAPVIFVDPGSRSFVARLPGCEDAIWQTEVKASTAFDVPLTLTCRKNPPWALFVAGAGVAAVGLGFGVGTAVHSGARSEAADAKWVELYDAGGKSACDGDGGINKTSCDEFVAADADARTFRGLSIAGFVVGGAAVVAASMALISIVKSSPPSGSQGTRPSAVQISLGLAPSGGGAVFRGSFQIALCRCSECHGLLAERRSW